MSLFTESVSKVDRIYQHVIFEKRLLRFLLCLAFLGLLLELADRTAATERSALAE